MRTVAMLDAAIFPDDDPCNYVNANWWLVYSQGSLAVAFAGSCWRGEDLFLLRCGVLEGHRGKGLQRKLIKRRTRGIPADVITYTAVGNPHSANNLIACGFRMYEPNDLWAGDDVNYWLKVYS